MNEWMKEINCQFKSLHNLVNYLCVYFQWLTLMCWVKIEPICWRWKYMKIYKQINDTSSSSSSNSISTTFKSGNSFRAWISFIMWITNKRKPIILNYKIHNENIESVNNAKYVGVIINKHLKWIVTQTQSFLQRNLKRCSRATKEKAYKKYVEPILNYSPTVWRRKPRVTRKIRNGKKENQLILFSHNGREIPAQQTW